MATKCPKCQTENPDTLKFCGECGISLKVSKDISVTKTIETPVEEYPRGSTFAGRYKIIERLGTGGMGAVYRVEDTKIGQDIALKIIRPDIASDKKTVERFRNELKTTRMISHRNVCRMFDIGDAEGTYFITMEHVPGEDLKSFIRRAGKLDIPKAISIAKEVCEGLAEAHRLGVVHRDLKSGNIMIDKEGNARIMDFGIARSLRAKGITGEGIIIGTPEYMSPEQAEAKEVDQRSDIYSLGVIMYEMVTGGLPFEGDSPLSVAMKHKGEMPKDPKLLHAQIPKDLSTVILRCLEKTKDDRYQSAGELHSELENMEKGIPTLARAVLERKPFTAKEITVQFTLKKLFIPALIVVAAVAIGLILWKFLAREKAAPAFPSDKPSVAVLFFMNQTGDEDLDHWREAFPQWIITDLSQSKYINVLPADRLFSIYRNLNLLETRSYATEDLKNVAREGRVSHIFQASYSKAGDIFRIDYTLQKSDTLEKMASDYVTGENEESFPSLVDDITKKIKTSLELSAEQVESDIDRNANTITTSSPEAFKYYSIGRKLLSQGEYRKAIELFEQAAAIDGEFGEAYYYMGISYYNLSYRIIAKELWQKALGLKDKLSDRTRYRIEAVLFLLSEATWDKSIEAYKRVLEIYPDSVGVRNNLAALYRGLEEYQKAIDHFEICITKYGYDFIATYTQLASCYRNLGLYDKAKGALEKWLNNLPDHAGIHRSLAVIYRYQWKFDLALEEMDKAFALAPTAWRNLGTKGDIYLYMGDLKKAEEEYRKLLEKEEPVARSLGMERLGSLFRLKGRYKDSIEMTKKAIDQAEKFGEQEWITNRLLISADLDVTLGRSEEALKKCEMAWKSAIEAEDLDHQRRALNIRALSYLKMGRTEEAQRVAEQLKELIEQGIYKNQMRLYYHLMGRIELAKKNYAEAIEFFNKGLPFVLPTSALRMIYADSMGLAYYQSGNLKKAKEEYEKIDSLQGRLEYGDIYVRSFYMLGKIHEQQGITDKALEHYEKFLSLWEDADPGIAEAEDAKKRLAGLKD